MSTFPTWLQEQVDRRGDRVALVEPGCDPVTWAELGRRVAVVADVLAAAGLRQGGRLASFLPNGVLGVEVLLAAAGLGATTIGANTRYRPEDLRHVLEVARPDVLVASPSFLGIDYPDIVARAVDGLAQPPTVLWAAAFEDTDRGQVTRERRVEVAPGDPVVAFTTSGTTGRPKLAAHDHGTTLRHLAAAARSLRVDEESIGLLVLPFCGTFGFVSLFALLVGGGSVVVAPRFQAAEAAELIEAHRVTHFNGSDDMLLAVLDQGRDLSSWRHGVHADFNGRGLESVRRAEAVGVRLTGVYGSSETFALLARWDPDEDDVVARARNGGVPVDPAMEIRVADAADGVGELHLRGPSVLAGYLTPDGLTPPPVDDEGWFATGDLCAAAPGGGFLYLARMGDALRLSGFLVDPAEIEQHLLGHRSVAGAQVVGTTTEEGRTVAVAFVVPDPHAGPVADEDALLAHCRDGLANFKVPARIVLVDRFPTVDGANGVKVQKTALRELAAGAVRAGAP